MINRAILSKLRTYMGKKEILALVGSRQVGKTTLMKILYSELSKKSKKKFLNFEDQMILNRFEADFESFIELYVKDNDYLFIDEFQYAKDGGKKLKLIFDEYNVKLVISGSSAPELSIHSLGYLVGRVFIFEIYPLSFEEFLGFKDEKLIKLLFKGVNTVNLDLFRSYFNEFLIFGGYPQVVLENDKKFVLNSLVGNYLLKEIKDILSYKSSKHFEDMLKFLAITDSTLLNKSNISSDLSLHINKIIEMLNVLKNTYVLTFLQPFKEKKIKELIKSPKTYFLDLGFKNSLLNNFNSLNTRVDKGAILENFVNSELIKSGVSAKFYNYKNSSEVDFLINHNGSLYIFEIKSNLSGKKISRGLRVFIQKYSPKLVYIFNSNVEGSIIVEGSKVVFLHYLNISTVLKKFV